MPVIQPIIDDRDQKKLVERIRELAVGHCPEWENISSIQEDKQADALIHIFSRMMEIIIQRLNKVPDKNFLTFLDMVGVRLSPKKIARAPLTFTMAKKVTQQGSIPAGIQVAAEQPEVSGQVVFETEKNLTVIPQKLIKAVTLSPADDKWRDHSPVFFENKEKGVEDLFRGTELIGHRMCLGHGTLFNFKETATLRLDVTVKNNLTKPEQWEVKWYCYKSDSQEKIPLQVADDKDSIVNLYDSGIIEFININGISEKALKGFENGKEKSWTNYWIFAELVTPIPEDNLPEIKTIKASVGIEQVSSACTGTISNVNEDVKVTGVKTSFTHELKIGDAIIAAGQIKIVDSISLDTSLEVDSPFKPQLDGTSFTHSTAGKGTISSDGTIVESDVTAFRKELKRSYAIIAAGQIRIVESISSNTSLTVDSPFKPPPLERTRFAISPKGTGTISSSEIAVTGDRTVFENELMIDDAIIIAADQIKFIQSISSNTSLIVDSPFKPQLPEGTSFAHSTAGEGTIKSVDEEVIGSETAFENELMIGDAIIAAGQIKFLESISSNTSLTVDSPFVPQLLDGTSFTHSTAGKGTISSNENDPKIIESHPFSEELKVGHSITAADQTRIVTAVISHEELTIDSAFEPPLPPGTTYFYAPPPPPPPDSAFYNNVSLDLTTDFQPFGDKPKFNDTFYISSETVFAKKGATIIIGVILSDTENLPDTEKIVLSWEFYDGRSWVKLGESRFDDGQSTNHSVKDYGHLFEDSTKCFKKNGQVTFKCPKIETIKINDEENYWVRIRIIDGNYGDEATYIANSNAVNGVTLWDYVKATYKPPSISTLTLAYSNFEQSMQNLETVLTYNDFLYQDQTEACRKEHQYFKPFQPSRDETPALYLAFNDNIATLPVTMFFPLLEKNVGARITPVSSKGTGTISGDKDSEEVKGNGTAFTREMKRGDEIAAAGQTGTIVDISSDTLLTIDSAFEPPLAAGTDFSYFIYASLFWEYWSGKKWDKLEVEDYTENLTKRELVQFRVPIDFAKRYCFNFEEEHYWIRLRLKKGTFIEFPRLESIYTNTMWAHNLITINEEKLGSSNGNPNQVLKFSLFPVIERQKVLVKEFSLTDEEKGIIITEEGEDAVEEIPDSTGNITGYRVRWHEMEHFYFSKPNSRHYIIDRNRGEIIFGDGERGMIPPGGNEITCSYRSGGGGKGNVKAETINKPRTTFPYIDSVTNHVAADGGAEEEKLERARELGPQTIKHRDRAVTYEDFEWLAKEASPKVARVKCLPNKDPSLKSKPGWVTLMIVPESEELKPLPTMELANVIDKYLDSRTPPIQINLTGPGYIGVRVKAEVIPKSIIEAKTVEGRIIDNLDRFLHPLHGGPEEKGWAFGRNVYISEVYEVIENTEGVDYVHNLILDGSVQIYTVTFKEILPDPEHNRVESDDESILFSLAKRDEGNTLIIIGFKEGDQVTLTNPGKTSSITLTIKSVSSDRFGDILECEPTWADNEFAEGSIVETSDKRIKSFILNYMPAQDYVTYLMIARFDNGNNVKEYGTIEGVSDEIDTIFVNENYLVYSGKHEIYSGKDEIGKKARVEPEYPYLFNTNSKEVHNLNNEQPGCGLNWILRENMKFLRTLDTMDGYDYCAKCFPGLSTR